MFISIKQIGNKYICNSFYHLISNVLSSHTYLANGFSDISYSLAATFARGHSSSACALHTVIYHDPHLVLCVSILLWVGGLNELDQC